MTMTAQTIAANELVERLQGLLEKATPGPWLLGSGGGSIRAQKDYEDGTKTFRRIVFGNDGSANQRDADFALIVETHNALPDLLATITRLTDELAGVKEALRPFGEHGAESTWLDRYHDDEHVDTCAFTAADFRRARALLGGRE